MRRRWARRLSGDWQPEALPEVLEEDEDYHAAGVGRSGRAASGLVKAGRRRSMPRHGSVQGILREGARTRSLDWSQCPAVESIPGRVSGAWVLRGTRTPVKVLFENLEAGMSIEEVIEQFPVSRKQLDSLMAFVARSLEKAPSYG